MSATSNGKQPEAFETGPILFSVNNPETNSRIELHLDSEEFRGEEDEMEVSVHSFHAGVEERMPVHMHLMLSMKLQQEIWRLDAITVSAKLPLGDPHLFDQSMWMAPMIAGNTADLGNVLAGDPPKPKITPIRAVRRMALAENIYAQKHPDTGFTCAISNLVNVGHGLDDGEPYKFVDPEFAGGVYNGYRFALRGCDGRPSKSFQVVAEPINGKGKAYCSDDRLNSALSGRWPGKHMSGFRTHRPQLILNMRRKVRAYFLACSTLRLFCTSKTPGTPFARKPARSLSPWLFTTPSSATCPPFTMM